MTEGGSNCEEALREVQRFLDGELDPAIRVRLELHISDCPPCMQKVEFRRHLKIMVSSKCSGDAVPTQFDQKIRDLIRALDQPPG